LLLFSQQTAAEIALNPRLLGALSIISAFQPER
jgi:hypothetical protein